MTKSLLWLLFSPCLLACTCRAQDAAASPAASAQPPAYRAWPAYHSSRFPIVLYRAAETDAGKNAAAQAEARGEIFRIEEIWAQFEADHPGFTITVDHPIEVPAAWNADRQFGKLAKADPHICPIAGSDDPNAAWSDAWNVLDSALRVTTHHALPAWLYEMLVAQNDNVTLETGIGTLPMLNPNRFFKMSDAGNFSDLNAIAKQGWSDGPPTSFDEMRARLWEYWSMRMYVDYAREAAAGAGLRDAITGVLLAAQNDGTDAAVKRLLADDRWTPQVKAYWQSVAPDAYVLEHHLQASAQIWAALAAYADRAGTHYPSFGGLVTA
ncbi:MAG TPA: hypothetical protein VHY22_18870, partial [Chthoniobacteraceae bacterium]|nr:hypothetical protein [Chthoniobacteraceae bacterium]